MTYEEYRSNAANHMEDDLDSQDRLIIGLKNFSKELTSKVYEKLNGLVANKFTVTELELFFRICPTVWYLSQAELYVLWEAFSETCCASFLSVRQEYIEDFVRWIWND